MPTSSDYLEDGGRKYCRNFGTYWPNYTTSYPTSHQCYGHRNENLISDIKNV